ncbi:MAG: hydroxymethylglutaryl-CoA reductase, degradative [Euryarchaeota archaeon]|nr:hydroxymethylglutaryl-CoA reductase, degradative [Euryarchaeota archaeon]|tara:strand:- start:2008 stop:3306 length:1299 start_codon:yes stop_codon:yes gene_type:complete
MPVEDSRLSGFYKLSVTERRNHIAKLANLSPEDVAALASHGELGEVAADRMIENVIGTMSLPVGVATNFVIDGKPYLIPFCVEESSIVAAASNMAKRCLVNGGFRTNNDEPLMIAQIQILETNNIEDAKEAVLTAKYELMAMCNSLPSTMIKLGGGCKDIVARIIDTVSGPMLIVHLIVDTRDAMGANAVNTMAELVTDKIEEITNGRVHLRILSNLATYRLAKVEATFSPEELSNNGSREEGMNIISGILEAHHFAMADPYRATTHNKGIMNAISAIALACGQDWRAIEAGCHAWAAVETGKYSSMTRWRKDEQGNLVGSIETPMAVGIVGGASKVHPAARANLAIIGVESAQELAGIMAAAGIAQNLGAMRALATNGIQAGHMKLHARNMAVSAGALGDEVEIVANIVNSQNGPVTQQLVKDTLEEIRRS